MRHSRANTYRFNIKNMTQYVCTALQDQSGVQICTAWEEVPPPQPSLLPNLTVEEANSLGIAIIIALISAYGWKQLQQVF